MDYLLGDLQGCCDPLDRMLASIDFSPSRDRLHVLGDLVNRGPQSLQVLERLAAFGDAAVCLMGNHDLHLLAVAHGVRRAHRGDTFQDILDSPRRAHWLEWLRHRPLAARACGWLLVHAGVVPHWTAEATLAHAAEAQAMLRGPDLAGFLPKMYGNEPRRWRDDLPDVDRWRFIINTLTRIRFCTAGGELEFDTKDSAAAAPPGFAPWFSHPGRLTAGVPIAFGHWSTLGLIDSPDLLALDTGCLWGRQLSAMRVDGGRRELFQIDCAQAQTPG